MDEQALVVRNLTYALYVELGRAPAADEVARATGLSGDEVVAVWRDLHCAWDAAGICAALHVDGSIKTSCPDCGEAITLEVRDQRVEDERGLFHRDRLAPNRQPHIREQNQAILDRLELTGDFWRLG